MARNKYTNFENLHIEGIDPKGRGIAYANGKTVLVENSLPNEVVDARPCRKKKGAFLARPTAFHTTSPARTEPFCKHFGICGGCKWQNVDYNSQLTFKADFVVNAFQQEGIELPDVSEIIGNSVEKGYRNKMEFSFGNRRWVTREEIDSGIEITNCNALGLHPTGAFDKVLDLEECYLQPEPSESIRKEVKRYADDHGLEFFDIRNQEGFLRNLVIRIANTGEVMVILLFYREDEVERRALLDHLLATFPEITSLYYSINGSKNDFLYNQEMLHYAGNQHILEDLGSVRLRIGPKSFFQTNSRQALKLYEVATEIAGLQPDDVVFDLYSGIGSIGLFIADKVQQVIGVEFVPEAVEDAKANAAFNNIENASFYVGDMKDVFTEEFLETHPRPDVVITDPPRAGMHPSVVKTLLKLKAPKIVYVSCNPETQARDIAMMTDDYRVRQMQAVDLFPQTYHVENVALLERMV